MVDINTITSKEFDQLDYVEKLNVYENMSSDFFLCYRNIKGEFVAFCIDSTEELSQSLSLVSEKKLEYFYIKPKSLMEYSQLLTWMLEKRHYRNLLYFSTNELMITQLSERLSKSQFPKDTLDEVKESVLKDYQSIRNKTIDKKQLHTQTETSALFQKLGVDAHREGILDGEKYANFIQQIANYQLQFSESFSFIGLIKAFNNYLSGYNFSQFYKFLIVEKSLDIPEISIIASDENLNKTQKGAMLKGKRLKVMKLIVDEMKSGTQLTDAVNASYSKAGYKYSRQIWNIIKSIRKGTLEFEEFTEIDVIS
jgi:hypothetical protein